MSIFGRWLEELRFQYLPKFAIPGISLANLADPIQQNVDGLAPQALHRPERYLRLAGYAFVPHKIPSAVGRRCPP